MEDFGKCLQNSHLALVSWELPEILAVLPLGVGCTFCVMLCGFYLCCWFGYSHYSH